MKIIGYDYKIVETENNDSDTLDAFGKLFARKQIIKIASDLVDQQRQSTVLHEIIEAINYHLQLKLEHHAIMGLESALFQILVDLNVDMNIFSDLIERE